MTDGWSDVTDRADRLENNSFTPNQKCMFSLWPTLLFIHLCSFCVSFTVLETAVWAVWRWREEWCLMVAFWHHLRSSLWVFCPSFTSCLALFPPFWFFCCFLCFTNLLSHEYLFSHVLVRSLLIFLLCQNLMSSLRDLGSLVIFSTVLFLYLDFFYVVIADDQPEYWDFLRLHFFQFLSLSSHCSGHIIGVWWWSL